MVLVAVIRLPAVASAGLGKIVAGALARLGGGGIIGGINFFRGCGGGFFIKGGKKGGGVEIVTVGRTSDAL